MGQPYVGEIRMFGGNFPPNGWLFCDGQQLAIDDYDVLFNLIGTTYGGDGESNFNLPDLRGRTPIHMGTGPDGTTYQIGEMAGVESVTLSSTQIPVHNHSVKVISGAPNATTPGPTTYLSSEATTAAGVFTYAPYDGTLQTNLSPAAIGPAGGSQPHDNMQPFLAVNYIISLFGIYPSQT